MSYSEKETAEIVESYLQNPTRDTVEGLANRFEKSIKSIIGKLSREGVYRREVYRSKTGELPVTKVEIVSNIAEYLGVENSDLEGLEKSPKAVLQKLEKALAGFERDYGSQRGYEEEETMEFIKGYHD